MADAPMQQVMAAQKETIDLGGEETPAYEVLRKHNLLEGRFRLEASSQLDAEPSNATPWGNAAYRMCCCPLVSCQCVHMFKVDAGQVRLVEDGRGNYKFYAQGVHRIIDPFYKIGGIHKYQKGHVSHGDLTLAVVEQGQIGYAVEKGNPILLPPGLHQWRSPTMGFENTFNLDNNVVRMGPLTLVTVDSGYSAVTEDNGEQHILKGGATYLLTHRNWKFQKYLSSKIQSSNLKRIEATSADNVLMAVDATVIWRITDVETAALNSVETIMKDGGEHDRSDVGSIKKLQNDVLKQAEASLAAYIGAVNYSDTFNVAAAVQKMDTTANGDGAVVTGRPIGQKSSALFDVKRMQSCLAHANAITATYGVTMLSINVVAAVPAERALMMSLAAGAVAAAEAQKAETVASGFAAATKIEAAGGAEADMLKAKGHAQAAKIRAEGQVAAADKLAENNIASRMAMIDQAGQSIGNNKAFFFGGDNGTQGSLSTAVVAGAAGGSGSKGGAGWFG